MTNAHGVNVTQASRSMVDRAESEGRERVPFTARTGLRRARITPIPGGGKPQQEHRPGMRCHAAQEAELYLCRAPRVVSACSRAPRNVCIRPTLFTPHPRSLLPPQFTQPPWWHIKFNESRTKS